MSKKSSKNKLEKGKDSLQVRLKRGWQNFYPIVQPLFSIFGKLFVFALSLSKKLWYLRVLLILSSEATLEHLLETFWHWLGISPLTLLLLKVLCGIALVLTFLVAIRKEVLLISKTIQNEFQVEGKTVSYFLFLLFALVAVFIIFSA